MASATIWRELPIITVRSQWTTCPFNGWVQIYVRNASLCSQDWLMFYIWEWVHTCVDQIETQRDWGWKNRKWSDVIDEGQREKTTLRSAQILAIWHCSSFQEICAQLLQCVQRSEIRQSARPLDSVPETSQSTIACGSFSCETVLKICRISCA